MSSDCPLTDAGTLVCSDHAAAKRTCMELIAEMDDMRPLDAGDLTQATPIEAFTAVLLQLNVRYKTRAAVLAGRVTVRLTNDSSVEHNVTIVAPLNLPATMPEHASALYARNLQAVIEPLADADSGALAPDFDDEVIAAACVVRDGEIVLAGHPTPAGRG